MSRQATRENGPRLSRVLVVDDHPIVREGLVARIGAQPELECCGEADSVETALQAIKLTWPDLILVDISLKNSNGLDLIKRVRNSYPAIKLLVVSVHTDKLYVERALRAGATGYVNKQAAAEELIDAITCALQGRVYLSPELAGRKAGATGEPQEHAAGSIESLTDRELQVFELIGQGRATKEIAAELELSVHTIDTYRDKIKMKLQLKGTPALIRRAVQWLMERES